MLGAVESRACVQGANEQQRQETSARYVHVFGLPGCGKTEAMVCSAHGLALEEGCHVAVRRPTGVLVSLYSERLPESERIIVQTIHSLFGIAQGQRAGAGGD